MLLEPVLLEAPLTAVLRWLSLALWTSVEGNELLVEIGCVVVFTRHRYFEYLLQGANVVFALTHVDNFVVRRCWHRLHELLLLFLGREVVQIILQMLLI